MERGYLKEKKTSLEAQDDTQICPEISQHWQKIIPTGRSVSCLFPGQGSLLSPECPTPGAAKVHQVKVQVFPAPMGSYAAGLKEEIQNPATACAPGRLTCCRPPS